MVSGMLYLSQLGCTYVESSRELTGKLGHFMLYKAKIVQHLTLLPKHKVASRCRVIVVILVV